MDICEKVKSGCVLIVSWIVNNLVDVNIKLKIMLIFNSDFCFRIEYFLYFVCFFYFVFNFEKYVYFLLCWLDLN